MDGKLASRTLALACALLIALPVMAASNKWRLQCSGDAKSDGEIELVLTPKDGTPDSIVVPIVKGTNENNVAKQIVQALRTKYGKQTYEAEVDDGEDVLVKARRGTPAFDVTIPRNTTGVRISPDKE
jgi:hypothetical protein